MKEKLKTFIGFVLALIIIGAIFIGIGVGVGVGLGIKLIYYTKGYEPYVIVLCVALVIVLIYSLIKDYRKGINKKRETK